MGEFEFEEAISYLRSGLDVCDSDGRTYTLQDGNIICYPDKEHSPNFRRVVTNFKADWIINGKWHLA